MRLRGINFGRVWGASGVQGFFGEGYWFHHWLRSFGLNFDGAAFVAKTGTLYGCKGNMPLTDAWRPVERFPKCVKIAWVGGYALNAVGLSGPAATRLFETKKWQKRTRPFFISFMAIGRTPAERIEELQRFVHLFQTYRRSFITPIGLQMNYSCPNTGHDTRELIEEVEVGLTEASQLGIPLIPKFNILLSTADAVRIGAHPACDGVCISNTIPWGACPKKIDWESLFGTKESPLARYGGGGLSGKPLFPLVLDWVTRARKAGFTKHLNAGGGILSKNDAIRMLHAGADSISLGSVAFLRPWRVKGIIGKVNAR